MIVAILIGFITGWLMSMPIGPVNAAVISRTLKYNFKFGIACGIGGSLMDLIYCACAAQINQFLVESPIINMLFQSVGCLALLYLGWKQIKAPRKEKPIDASSAAEPNEQNERAEETVKRFSKESKSYVGPFMLGVLLYATNVAAVPEWIIVSGLWRSWGLLGSGVATNVAFAIGAAFGTMGWYLLLIRWIARRQRGFEPSTLAKINLGTGIAMLVFGVYFGGRVLLTTDWHVVGQRLSMV